MTQDYMLLAAFILSGLACACACLALWLVPSDEEIGRVIAKEVRRQVTFWATGHFTRGTPTDQEEAAWKSLRGEGGS